MSKVMENNNSQEVLTLKKVTSAEQQPDLVSIMIGACFLGAGGGGGLSLGRQVIDQIDVSQVKRAVKLESLPYDDNDWQTVIAGVGSPEAGDNGIDLSQFVNAYTALKNNNNDKNIVALTPVELGAVNTIIPFYVASKANASNDNKTNTVNVIDGDTAGRAVPELEMTLLNLHNIPISPMFLAAAGTTQSRTNTLGPVYNYSCINIRNASDAEDVVRDTISSSTYNEVGGLTLYASTIQDLLNKEGSINYGSVSLCEEIGKLFKRNINKTDFEIEMRKILPFRKKMHELFEGTLTKLHVDSGGFDSGFAEFTDESGDLFLIYFKNENILAWDCKKQKPIAIAPDSICYLYHNPSDDTVFPISNAEFMNNLKLKINDDKEVIIDVDLGSKITVFGLPAIEGMRSQKMLNSFMDIVSTFKPLSKYETIEVLHKHGK